MSNQFYGVIAYAMRYWFLALTLAALCASVGWMRRAAVIRRRRLAGLPDAGMIGEWALLDASGETAALLPAPADGMIGGDRHCDVRVEGMPRFAARYALEKDGLHLRPFAPGKIAVDGQPVQRKAVLRHGATLSCGGYTLQLRLFAGVLLKGETPAPAAGGEASC